MTDQQKRTITIIANWLRTAVTAEQLDALNVYLEATSGYPNDPIADALRTALGYRLD